MLLFKTTFWASMANASGSPVPLASLSMNSLFACSFSLRSSSSFFLAASRRSRTSSFSAAVRASAEECSWLDSAVLRAMVGAFWEA